MPPRHNPVIRYPYLQSGLNDPGPLPAQQAALPAEWAVDPGDRSTASEEGMVSPSPAQTDRDVQMLDRVIAARVRLAKAAARSQLATPAKSIT